MTSEQTEPLNYLLDRADLFRNTSGISRPRDRRLEAELDRPTYQRCSIEHCSSKHAVWKRDPGCWASSLERYVVWQNGAANGGYFANAYSKVPDPQMCRRGRHFEIGLYINRNYRDALPR